MFIQLKSIRKDVIDIDKIRRCELWERPRFDGSSPYKYGFIIYFVGEDCPWKFEYGDKEGRDQDYKELVELVKKQRRTIGGSKMFKTLKQYFENHQDVIITIVVVMIIDHLFFEGSLRGRVKKMLEGVLGKAEKSLEVR